MRKIFLPFAAVFLAGAVSAYADTITFNFNPLANGASDSQVQTYMRGLLAAGESVTVTGAGASNSYTGDGHVVGPVIAGTVRPLTLADTDNGVPHGGPADTFILNSGSNDILMQFTGITIYSVSFDLEIFPDGTCPTGTDCGSNWPDFTFDANGKLVHEWLAAMPGSLLTPYTHSPNSGTTLTELAPQLLTTSGTWNFASGVTSLDFIDWPATIGIDNLVITTTPPSKVPEPSTMLLLATGIAGLVAARKMRTA